MLKPGSVLLLEHERGLTIGVVLDGQDPVRVQTPDGAKSVPLSTVRRASSRTVEGAAEDPEFAAEVATKHLASVQRYRERLDLARVWEKATAGQRGPGDEPEPMGLRRLAALAFGPDPHDLPAAVDVIALALLSDTVYFRAEQRGFVPAASSVVRRAAQDDADAAAKLEVDDDDERAAEVLQAAMRRRSIEGIEPGDTAHDWLVRLNDCALSAVDVPDADRILEFTEKLVRSGRRALWRRAFDILVRVGWWSADVNLDLRRLRLGGPFDAASLEQAESIVETRLPDRDPDASRDGQRPTFEHPDTIAIDDPDTADVDDALWARKLDSGDIEAWVLIADPAEVIDLDSPLGTGAKQRGATLYLPDRTVAMLPPSLSERALSLTPGEPRFALGFRMLVAPDGTLREFDVCETILELGRRLTYDQVDASLAKAPESELDSSTATMLATLSEAAQRLRDRRRRDGAVLLQQPEVKVRVDQTGAVHVVVASGSSMARQLVAEMMIGTGAAVGSFCWERGIPAVYRGQSEPEEPIVFDESRAADVVYHSEVLQHMRRAESASEPRGHFGLGLQGYALVTSPLRRYQDLVIHHQLKGYLRVGSAPMGEREMLDLFGEVETTTSQYGRLERDARRYWILRDLEKSPKRTLKAIALRPLRHRYLLYLPEFNFNEVVTPNRPLEAGDRLLVALAGVDSRGNRLRLNVAAWPEELEGVSW